MSEEIEKDKLLKEVKKSDDDKMEILRETLRASARPTLTNSKVGTFARLARTLSRRQTKKSQRFTISKIDKIWVCKKCQFYPALVAKMQKLLSLTLG